MQEIENKVIRQSNFELLRVVAMIMIAVWHVIIHGFHGELECSAVALSFLVYGVNLFALISGYFGIKLKVKSLLGLIWQLIFYVLVTYFVSIVLFDIFSPPYMQIKGMVYQILFPISYPGYYWFVNTYIFLMLLSPFVNAVLCRANYREKLLLVLVLAYFSCFSGWFFKNRINEDGYNIVHFVFLYVLGNFIKSTDILKEVKAKWCFFTFLAFSFLTFFLSKFELERAFLYNSPFVVLGSVAFFCLFANLRMKANRWLNYVASCMFPVYLIQDGYFGHLIYKEIYKGYSEHGVDMPFILGYFVLLFLTAIIIESFRRPVMKPLVNVACKYIVRVYDRFMN